MSNIIKEINSENMEYKDQQSILLQQSLQQSFEQQRYFINASIDAQNAFTLKVISDAVRAIPQQRIKIVSFFII